LQHVQTSDDIYCRVIDVIDGLASTPADTPTKQIYSVWAQAIS